MKVQERDDSNGECDTDINEQSHQKAAVSRKRKRDKESAREEREKETPLSGPSPIKRPPSNTPVDGIITTKSTRENVSEGTMPSLWSTTAGDHFRSAQQDPHNLVASCRGPFVRRGSSSTGYPYEYNPLFAASNYPQYNSLAMFPNVPSLFPNTAIPCVPSLHPPSMLPAQAVPTMVNEQAKWLSLLRSQNQRCMSFVQNQSYLGDHMMPPLPQEKPARFQTPIVHSIPVNYTGFSPVSASDLSPLVCELVNDDAVQKKDKEMKAAYVLRKTKEGLSVCAMCMSCFPDKLTLDKHNRIYHRSLSQYKCVVCLKSFSKRSRLNRHFLSHTGERAHQCTYCSKRFSQKSDLVMHIRTHTGERPFKCEICKKDFTQKVHLNVHRRVHTGERPYKCQQCTKAFATKANLKSHMRTHTGEKPYTCSICKSSFKQNSHLVAHRKAHHYRASTTLHGDIPIMYNVSHGSSLNRLSVHQRDVNSRKLSTIAPKVVPTKPSKPSTSSVSSTNAEDDQKTQRGVF